jgi:hypothetical protein
MPRPLKNPRKEETLLAETTERTVVSAWMPTNLAAEIARLARDNDRSVSGELRVAVREHLESVRRASAVRLTARASE